MADQGRYVEHPPTGVRDRFCDELVASADPDDAARSVADRLCRACVAVLPFTGAGLSFGLRVNGRLPLGASDGMAALAERLQFTTGTGPCSTAQRTRMAIVVSQQEVQEQWPGYAAQLGEQTDYRSTVAVPVGGPLSGAVVLDLYSTQPERPSPDVLDDVRIVADVTGEELAADLAAEGPYFMGLPPVLNTPLVAARQQVWVAAGILAHRHGVDGGTALALLRGVALAHGLDVDTAADRVARGQLDL